MTVKSESKVAQSCPTLSDPMDCSLPGSSVHGIFQARVLEWVAIALTQFTESLNVAMFWAPLHFLQIRESDKEIWSSALVIQNNLFSCYLLTGGMYNDNVELNTLCALQTNT